MNEKDYAKELWETDCKAYMSKPKPAHCSMCWSVDIGEYFVGPNTNAVCPKCLDFMNKQIYKENMENR